MSIDGEEGVENRACRGGCRGGGGRGLCKGGSACGVISLVDMVVEVNNEG